MVSVMKSGWLAVALLVPSVILAQTPEATPSAVAPAVEAATAPQNDKPVCSWQRATGSNIPRKVCLSASEREAMRQQNQQVLRDAHLNTPASRE